MFDEATALYPSHELGTFFVIVVKLDRRVWMAWMTAVKVGGCQITV